MVVVVVEGTRRAGAPGWPGTMTGVSQHRHLRHFGSNDRSSDGAVTGARQHYRSLFFFRIKLELRIPLGSLRYVIGPLNYGNHQTDPLPTSKVNEHPVTSVTRGPAGSRINRDYAYHQSKLVCCSSFEALSNSLRVFCQLPFDNYHKSFSYVRTQVPIQKRLSS